MNSEGARQARCLPFQDVLFALLPTSYSTRETRPLCSTGRSFASTATAHCRSSSPRGPRQKPLRLRSIYAAGDNQYSFTIEKVFDFDGDGSPELMIEFTDAVYEGRSSARWSCGPARRMRSFATPGSASPERARFPKDAGGGRGSRWSSGHPTRAPTTTSACSTAGRRYESNHAERIRVPWARGRLVF